ncbi:MAG TPA: hypothetical protein EYH06_04030 [Chromatiales bacterium]|nr:hypothetical protein [Thiotrichales bacterium]HIP67742.1 hypothetical protein [Chromatiales bacterium]
MTAIIMDDAISLLERLAGILDSEQQVLMSTDLNGLAELVADKQRLLEKLAILEPHILTALHNDSAGHFSKVVDLLESCRQVNLENNALALQGKKNIDHSISFIKSVMQVSAVNLYDPSGKAGNETAKRDIGQA